jgi:hypothetical protein
MLTVTPRSKQPSPSIIADRFAWNLNFHELGWLFHSKVGKKPHSIWAKSSLFDNFSHNLQALPLTVPLTGIQASEV